MKGYQWLFVLSIAAYLNGCMANCGQCKKKCQSHCVSKSGGVALNQCWGTPKYRICKCSDDTRFHVPGCPCEHPSCPSTQGTRPPSAPTAPGNPTAPAPPPARPNPPPPAPPAPAPPAGGRNCVPTAVYRNAAGMKAWCNTNCNAAQPICPPSHCVCN